MKVLYAQVQRLTFHNGTSVVVIPVPLEELLGTVSIACLGTEMCSCVLGTEMCFFFLWFIATTIEKLIAPYIFPQPLQ